MSSKAHEPIAPVPEHVNTITPRLVVRNADSAIDLYRRAFGAEPLGEPFRGPSGELIHAEVRIGNSVVMLTDETDPGAPASSPQSLDGTVTAIMATYWPDVDAVWRQAVAEGAEIIYPLRDQFYGERAGRLRDPFGQQWMLSQRIESFSGDAEPTT